ncbi:MAG: excinuclease ABC subunit UvrC [Clostridia bacterium]|nr:excinuclease ABC subunit UvrC [Clostridia bacterium]
MNALREKLKLLPDSPGVYIMLDKDGAVIYVGKARVLKNRVRQYFHGDEKPEKVAAMVANIADFNYIVCATESDALSLENTLIKKYKPKYNILLKDDKTYPYIKMHTKEAYPYLSITRKIKKDGKYFGPFMGGVRCKDILEMVAMLYNVRTCKVAVGEKPKRPCLEYHLHRCSGPCAHECSQEEYAEQVKKALRFLDGEYEEAEEILKQKMLFFAQKEEFEIAMNYREKLGMLSALKQKRLTALNRYINADIISLQSNGLYAAASVLVTRKGIMQGGKSYALEDASLEGKDALTAFLLQYYARHQLPEEIITEAYCEKALLEEYFLVAADKKVEITFAKQGVKKELFAMAERNAAEYLAKNIEKIKHKDDMTKRACERLQSLLGLKRYPRRMECYDISNISGVDKVASMVVFIDGEADRTSYRRFKIKTVEGANDFASLQETLRRRLQKLGTDEEFKFPKPDLVIIDGGKGQLSAVQEIFSGMGVSDIELISLAKREEEVFTLDREDSVKIPHTDFALKMLQRIRDEAHRFAISYFRNLHSKRNLASILQEIEGVGAKKQKALMQKFSTLDKILSASVQELAQAEGIGEELAQRIKTFFEEKL